MCWGNLHLNAKLITIDNFKLFYNFGMHEYFTKIYDLLWHIYIFQGLNWELFVHLHMLFSIFSWFFWLTYHISWLYFKVCRKSFIRLIFIYFSCHKQSISGFRQIERLIPTRNELLFCLISFSLKICIFLTIKNLSRWINTYILAQWIMDRIFAAIVGLYLKISKWFI